ncbi:hypothetical protein [Coraliomargarita parva]|uniref:hypothetical protein n=1 Tax=Coraliomargarita parva TaxID=3014050 RepID=UPI0022B37351|nr:hypothetical protein [Coraliomargarita parva]
MPLTRKVVFLIAALASLCSVTSHAAETDEALISIRFSCYALGTIDARGLYYLDEGEPRAFRISSAFRRGPYDYTGPNPLVFYRDGRSPDGSTIRIPVASARIDPALKELLLFFVNNDAHQPGEATPEMKVIVMNDDLRAFPAGAYRVFNLSEHEIGCLFGEEKFIVPGKDYKTVNLDEGDQVNVRIHFSSNIDGEWVPQINTRWLYSSNERNIVFVADDYSTRHPRLKINTITQYLEQ